MAEQTTDFITISPQATYHSKAFGNTTFSKITKDALTERYSVQSALYQ